MKIEHYDLNGRDLEIPIPESYRDCMTLIKSDRYRISGRMESSIIIILKNLIPSSRKILFWLRLSQYKGFFWPFTRIIYECLSRRAQVQISPKMRIGYGFYIGHGICIVINYQTVIGNNVNISQFLNIGTNNETPAIIGNNVWIGPHVSIVEDVRIVNNSSIGAGAVVTKNIPENATAVGVPAHVLNYNQPAKYIINPF